MNELSLLGRFSKLFYPLTKDVLVLKHLDVTDYPVGNRWTPINLCLLFIYFNFQVEGQRVLVKLNEFSMFTEHERTTFSVYF